MPTAWGSVAFPALWGALFAAAATSFWRPTDDPWALYVLIAFGVLSLTVLPDVAQALLKERHDAQEAASRAQTIALCTVNLSALLLWLVAKKGAVWHGEQQSGGGESAPVVSAGVLALGVVLAVNSVLPLWLLRRETTEKYAAPLPSRSPLADASTARDVALAAIGLLLLRAVRESFSGKSCSGRFWDGPTVALVGWAVAAGVACVQCHR